MRLLPDSKLTKADRHVLLAVLTYWTSASTLTLLMRTPGRSENALISMAIAGTAILLAVLVALWYGSRHGSISLGQFGFSHGWGMWVNLGIIALSTAFVMRQLPPTKFTFAGSADWKILGAFTEELVFRVYLIRIVSSLLAPRKGHLTWAVLLSAAFFTAGHLFRKTAAEMIGLFLSSVMAGYITYYTKSVLFAAYYHVLSNTAPELGLLGGEVSIAAYLVISLYSSFRRSHSKNLLGSEQG